MPSSFSSDADIERRVAELEARMAESATASDLDVVWIILSAVLVFFMQVGFAMVSVRLRALAPQNPSPGPQTTSPPTLSRQEQQIRLLSFQFVCPRSIRGWRSENANRAGVGGCIGVPAARLQQQQSALLVLLLAGTSLVATSPTSEIRNLGGNRGG